ncbi:MAG: Si-specific NAD(P)(+) transhydrogenase [Mariprofundaceae bacterium]
MSPVVADITHYDVLVIGSGPAGQRAAIQAAKAGKTVGVIERKPKIGGAGLQTGTIPSKALREVAYAVSVMGARGMRASRTPTPLPHHFLAEAVTCKDNVVAKQESLVLNQMLRNGVDLIPGQASFVDLHQLKVCGADGRERIFEADAVVLATGSRPRRPAEIPFDKTHVLDSTSILHLKQLPESLTIVGGGVISCEFATMFAALGVKVTIIDSHDEILSFLDDDIVAVLHESMQVMGISLHFNRRVDNIKRDGDRVLTTMDNGDVIHSDRLLYALGRLPNVDDLGIDRLGVKVDGWGRVQVNQFFQTDVSHIYAIGDLIGHPALAAVAMEQGRIAALHIVNAKSGEQASLLPIGIYTIPEVSVVGKSERTLQAEHIDYVVGLGRYDHTARGQIIGDHTGLLKLLVCRKSRSILGVHIVGESASELLHIGQLAISLNASIDMLAMNVFNYPTLAECYKVAALNCCNQLEALP